MRNTIRDTAAERATEGDCWRSQEQ